MYEQFIDRLAFPYSEVFVFLLFLGFAALIANFVVKRLFLLALDRLMEFTTWDEYLEIEKFKIIPRVANAIPAIIIDVGLSYSGDIPKNLKILLQNVTDAFIVLTLALATSGVIALIDNFYHRERQEDAPEIKGYIRISQVILFAITAILIVATLMNTSPFILISGLGAMTAVLILVFQETILALIAGFTITSSNMLRLNDWIEMPSLGVDGDVINISLYNVEVQNFDKTIVTIPIRKLTTESFKNWRGMKKSGGRRIKRAVLIDQKSIRFLNDEELLNYRTNLLLRDEIGQIVQKQSSWNTSLQKSDDYPGNRHRISNLRIFRIYALKYINSRSDIRHDMKTLVRQLAPSPQGVKIEIYCFSNTTDWIEYEDIQAQILEHLLAIVPEFDLSVYQYPTSESVLLPAMSE